MKVVDNCPGIDTLLRPTMKYIDCPSCGELMEIWSDDTESECFECGSIYTVPEEDASCLTYCEYASQCIELIKERKNTNG